MPHFWLGLLMIILFAVNLQLAPGRRLRPVLARIRSRTSEHMLMPAIVLGTGLSAVADAADALVDARLARRRLRADGAGEGPVASSSVVGVHALRNSLITVTTIIGLQLGVLISGAVITEQIFGIAGFGRLTIDAVNQRDYALIQGVVLVAAVGYVIVNLLVDVVYSLLNPRIRIVAAPA